MLALKLSGLSFIIFGNNFIHCSSHDPLVIELFDTVAPINGTLKELEKTKTNPSVSPDVSKSSAQLRLQGESGKFRRMFCQLCLLPRAATSALFVCGGGGVCKVAHGCFSHNVGMLTPDKRSFFFRPPSPTLGVVQDVYLHCSPSSPLIGYLA